MTNPITKALSDVKFTIPKPILERAFAPKWELGGMLRRTAHSLDYRIREEVINARVMEDCNLVGGAEVVIPLAGIEPQYLPDYKIVWHIPLTLTQNRYITRVYNFAYGGAGISNMGAIGASTGTLQGALKDLLATNAGAPNVTDAHIELVGRNTIMSRQNIVPSPDLHLRCVIENDAEFNNLPASAVIHFSKLVVFAVKSYIYNTLYLEMDRAEMSGGSDLGRFTSMVEGYADAEQNYQDFFQDHWRKIAFMSDPTAHQRHLRRIVGGRHV